MRLAAVLLSAALVVGCDSGRPRAELDRAKSAVVAALDSWKANEPTVRLKELADPVEFSEEMRSTHTLTAYTIGRVDGNDPDFVRVAVKLTLKDRKGKASERDVAYEVALKTPLVVCRDPYY